jgi:photosynthetic reaction center cytochrome c subunit
MATRILVLGLVCVMTWSADASAQGTFPPQSFSNLQVLPATSRADEIIGTMRDVTRALGVRCQFCHVGVEGQPLDTFDFVSDAIPKKQTARAMMRLVTSINAQLATGLTNGGVSARVTCYTCHRGAERPTHSPQGGRH